MAEDKLKEQIYEVLKEVYDPEIPVNIVDLGLVYDLKIEDGKVHIKMTLTSPACPIAPMIADDVKSRVMGIEGVKDVQVEFVWEPMWNPGMMSWEARDQLGLL